MSRPQVPGEVSVSLRHLQDAKRSQFADIWLYASAATCPSFNVVALAVDPATPSTSSSAMHLFRVDQRLAPLSFSSASPPPLVPVPTPPGLQLCPSAGLFSSLTPRSITVATPVDPFGPFGAAPVLYELDAARATWKPLAKQRMAVDAASIGTIKSVHVGAGGIIVGLFEAGGDMVRKWDDAAGCWTGVVRFKVEGAKMPRWRKVLCIRGADPMASKSCWACLSDAGEVFLGLEQGEEKTAGKALPQPVAAAAGAAVASPAAAADTQSKATLSGTFTMPNQAGGLESPHNPQVGLVLLASVAKLTIRMSSPAGGRKCAIRVTLCRSRGDGARVWAPRQATVGRSGTVRSGTVSLVVTNASAGRYVLLPALQKAGVCGPFSVDVDCGGVSAIQSLKILPDFDSRLVSGNWGKRNGGRDSMNNPQVFFEVLKRDTTICITLEDGNRSSAMEMFVARLISESISRVEKASFDRRSIVCKSRTMARASIQMIINRLDPGKYFVVLCSARKTLGRRPLDWKLRIAAETGCVGKRCFELGETGEVEEEGEIAPPAQAQAQALSLPEAPKRKLSFVPVPEGRTENPCSDVIKKHQAGLAGAKSYCNTNPYEDIAAACAATSGVFVDADFERGASGQTVVGSHKVDRVACWKRPTEFLDSPDLYVDGIDIEDMKQGGLGDCWLCQAIATAAISEKRISSLISPSGLSPCGCYVVKLFVDSDWRYVVVDDYFALLKNDSFAYAHCVDANELYVSVIEKAVAKALGGYGSLVGNQLRTGLHLLTGGESDEIHHRQTNPDALWRTMKEFAAKNWLMGGGTRPGAGRGLVSKHAYSIMSIHEIEGLRLIRIRNTWGKSEWTGPWSDDDDKHWTPKMKASLEFVKKDDGIFYMVLSDYFGCFSSTTVCKIVAESCPLTYQVEGGWGVESGVAGQWLEARNPKFPLCVHSPGTMLHVSLMRVSRGVKIRDNAVVVRLVTAGPLLTNVPKDRILVSSTYVQFTKTKFEFSVESPGDYMIVAACRDPWRQERFRILVRSSHKIDFGDEFPHVDPYTHKQTLAGPWTPSGGFQSLQNPHIKLTVTEGGTDVGFSFKRTDRPRGARASKAMIVYMLRGNVDVASGGRVQSSDVVSKSQYARAMDVSLAATKLEAGDYWLVPTFQFRVANLSYALKAWANKPIALKVES